MRREGGLPATSDARFVAEGGVRKASCREKRVTLLDDQHEHVLKTPAGVCELLRSRVLSHTKRRKVRAALRIVGQSD